MQTNFQTKSVYLPVHLHNPKFLVLRYPYCLGLLLQTNFQTKSVYLPVYLHNPKFLVLRYPYCLGLLLQTNFQTRVYIYIDFFLLGSPCSRCLLLFRWPAPRGGWGREVGGEGGAPGQARKPGSELGRALLGLCWGPAGNAVGPPTQKPPYF